jgi:hypothetical protein
MPNNAVYMNLCKTSFLMLLAKAKAIQCSTNPGSGGWTAFDQPPMLKFAQFFDMMKNWKLGNDGRQTGSNGALRRPLIFHHASRILHPIPPHYFTTMPNGGGNKRTRTDTPTLQM